MTYTIWLDEITQHRLKNELDENILKVENCTLNNGLFTKGKYSIPVNRAVLIFDES